MPSESVETVESVAYGQARPLRVFLNRLIFRGMIFGIGIIAVTMFRVLPNKNTTWKFVKARTRNLARWCGVRVHMRGREHLGSGPYVFTPNHQSHFDIVALLGHLPGNNRFAAKKELFREPILGLAMSAMGMVPVDRTDSEASIARLKRLKDDKFSVIIFPEGTRNEGALLPFKKGAFVAAIELGIPVVPIVCKKTDTIMPKGGYLSIYPGEVEIVILEPIPTTGMTYDDRNRLRELVRDRINEELGRPEARPA